MKLAVCSSAAFYENLFPIKDELEGRGHTVLLPEVAHTMQKEGNYNDRHYKTWYDNPDDFTKKAELMQKHLDCIDTSDAIVVINHEKNGVSGYIGGNVLLEIFYAWLNKKPIFILNPVEKTLPLYEEVLGMSPIFLDDDLSKIPLQ